MIDYHPSRFVVLLFFLLYFFNISGVQVGAARVSTLPRSAIVINAQTGEILYANNATKRSQPASLTKMMTLFLAFKAIRAKKTSLNAMITISKNAAAQKPCKIDLKAGRKISIKDAIMSMITKSANDAAVALAEHLANGSEMLFVRMMNAEARRLGMNNTVFANPSGWKNARQLSNAADMARLSRAIVTKFPEYYSLFSTKQYCIGKQCFRNHNNLLGNRNGIIIDGIKTGFVCASGYNIAVSAIMGGTRLIVVFFGGSSVAQRDELVNRLILNAFNKISAREAKRHLEKNKKAKPQKLEVFVKSLK